MDDKRTPMEAEVQELPPRREPSCPEDFYGTAAKPRLRRNYTWFWACLGLAVIAVSTFSVVAAMLHVRVENKDGGWRLSMRETEATEETEDPVRSLEITAAEDYTPSAKGDIRGNVGIRLADSVGETLTAADVYARVNAAVVCVEVAGYYGTSSYTGVVLSADGYILSATDGLSNALSVTVCFSDGSSLPAVRIGEEHITGLCLLKVEAEGLTAAAFAEDCALTVGQGVYCVCNPYGSSLPNLFSEGMVSACWQVEIGSLGCTVLQTTAQQDVGPGCPILDSQGRVVGLTTRIGKRLVSGDDPCFAISAADLVSLIADFEGGETAEGLWLGFEVEDIPEEYLYLFGYPGGLWISEVAEGSLAYGVLMQYDIITAVDGTEVSSAAEFDAQLSAHEPGDRVRLTLYRSGSWYTILLPVISR